MESFAKMMLFLIPQQIYYRSKPEMVKLFYWASKLNIDFSMGSLHQDDYLFTLVQNLSEKLNIQELRSLRLFSTSTGFEPFLSLMFTSSTFLIKATD